MSSDLPLPVPFTSDTKLNVLNDINTPDAPEANTYGYLYKKTASNGLFWNTLGGGETNLVAGTAVTSFGTADNIFDGGQDVSAPSNTKAGTNALLTLGDGTAGGACTAFGRDVLSALPDDTFFTCFTGFGYFAGTTLTQGSNSVLIGAFCAENFASSTNDIFIGHYAGGNGVANDSNNNVAIGYGSMSDPSFNGYDNIALGTNSMFAVTTAHDNIAIGTTCAASMTTGQSNVFMGSLTANNFQDGINCVAIGAAAMQQNVSTNSMTAVGASALLQTTGLGNTGVGFQAGSGVTSGTSNTLLGYNSAVLTGTFNNCIVLGASARASATNQIRIGFATNGSSVQTNTYIDGILGVTVDPGTGTAVNVDFTGKLGTVLSSKRYKHDINLLDNSLINKVYDLEPVSFIMNDDKNNNINYGLVAEDVRDVIPELVVFQDGIDDDGKQTVQTVKYHYLPPLLLGAIKQMKGEINELRARCEYLEGKI